MTIKRKNVEISTKINALRELEKGMPAALIASELGLQEQTVKKWRKSEEKIKNWQHSLSFDDLMNHRRRMMKGKNERVDDAVWLWFDQKRAAGCPISGEILMTKAKQFQASLGGPTVGSKGWLEKWQHRYGVRSKKICGEKLSANKEAAAEFVQKFPDLVSTAGLTPDQIFNCDETGLNWKLLPKSTLCAKTETDVTGSKGYKDRYTVMACSNASGSLKMPLVLIGKSARPRALRCVSTLEVSYMSQSSAWMNAELFTKWFHEEFVPTVTNFLLGQGLPLSAILFVDNCSAHPQNLSSGNIRVMFLPSNTTSLIQPMDQGCLQCLKMNYRQKLMNHTVARLDTDDSLTDALKKVDIRVVSSWAAEAWSEISPETIQKSWYQLWPNLPQVLSASQPDATLPAETRRNLLFTLRQAALVSYSEQLDVFLRLLQTHTNLQDVTRENVVEWMNPSTPVISEEFFSEREIIDIFRDQGDNQENQSSEIQPSEPPQERLIDKSTQTDDLKYLHPKEKIREVIEVCKTHNSYSTDIIEELQSIENEM